MTGTKEDDLAAQWSATKPLVSAVLLEHGATVSWMLGPARAYLSLRARSECTGETREGAKHSLAISRTFVRFAKAFKELQLAARAVQTVIEESRRSLPEEKGSNGAPAG